MSNVVNHAIILSGPGICIYCLFHMSIPPNLLHTGQWENRLEEFSSFFSYSSIFYSAQSASVLYETALASFLFLPGGVT